MPGHQLTMCQCHNQTIISLQISALKRPLHKVASGRSWLPEEHLYEGTASTVAGVADAKFGRAVCCAELS